MLFILLLGISALFVAGCAAYFSVFGIASLFSGSFIQVAIMASSLELGKLVATSFLYRYWKSTRLWLKTYLIVAILLLMGITSIGVFGYLSSAYQTNSTKYSQVDSQIKLLQEQKTSLDSEIEQNNLRIEVLNKARLAQEQRLPNMSSTSAKPVYADIERAGKEISELNTRSQSLQDQKFKKDQELLTLQTNLHSVKDIGTFSFVASAVNKPLDVVVMLFICLLILVFDPLAVCLILAYNVAVTARKKNKDALLMNIVSTKQEQTATPTNNSDLQSIKADLSTSVDSKHEDIAVQIKSNEQLNNTQQDVTEEVTVSTIKPNKGSKSLVGVGHLIQK